MINRCEAPWTSEQVESLNGYQNAGVYHPFTGEVGPDGERSVLIATERGWVETADGPIVQTWAHAFMADGSWRDHPMLHMGKASE
jgi:hypothetical protein